MGTEAPFEVGSLWGEPAGMRQLERISSKLRCCVGVRHSPIEDEDRTISTAWSPWISGIHRKVTWLLVFLPTGAPIYRRRMAQFTVTLAADRTEVIADADAYQQEGPLTTFFAFAGGREVIDSWSSRLASFRTVDVLAVRRVEPEITFDEHAFDEPAFDEPAFDEHSVAPLLRSA